MAPKGEASHGHPADAEARPPGPDSKGSPSAGQRRAEEKQARALPGTETAVGGTRRRRLRLLPAGVGAKTPGRPDRDPRMDSPKCHSGPGCRPVADTFARGRPGLWGVALRRWEGGASRWHFRRRSPAAGAEGGAPDEGPGGGRRGRCGDLGAGRGASCPPSPPARRLPL